MSAEERLAELGLELPPIPKPGGTYKPVVQIGNLLYVSGHGPVLPDRSLIKGKVGDTMTGEEANHAARVTGLAILATLKNYLGSLDKVVRTIKLLGMVNATPDFETHPAVINGCSDLFREVFGEDGVGARSAVGMGSLPGQIAVEIEVIFEVEE